MVYNLLKPDHKWKLQPATLSCRLFFPLERPLFLKWIRLKIGFLGYFSSKYYVLKCALTANAFLLKRGYTMSRILKYLFIN